MQYNRNENSLKNTNVNLLALDTMEMMLLENATKPIQQAETNTQHSNINIALLSASLSD